MGFKSFVKKKYGEAKEGIKKDMAYRKEVSTAAREAAQIERKKQAIATAISREQQRGKAARTTGGGFSQGLSYLSGVGGTTTRTAPTSRRKVTTYVKKGKHYVKKTSYKPIKSTANIKSISNNENQFDNIFGSSNKEKKKTNIFNMRF